VLLLLRLFAGVAERSYFVPAVTWLLDRYSLAVALAALVAPSLVGNFGMLFVTHVRSPFAKQSASRGRL